MNLPGRRGRVDGLLPADKLHLLLGQAFYEVEQVAGIAGKSLMDSTITVAAPDVFHHAGKFPAVGVLTAFLIDENLVNAELAQLGLPAEQCSAPPVLTRIYPIFMVYLS